jgi:ferrous-iron efflux pump FieF
MTIYSQEHIKLLKTAPYYSIGIALILCTIKGYIWITTGSATLFASLMDSLLDFTASVINLIAIRMALMPPDHNHRFGHNKIEDLAVFGQSLIFFLFGIITFYHSVERFIKPKQLEQLGIGVYAMLSCSAITFALVIYQSYVIKKTKSSIIKADRLHYIIDFLTDILVIISFTLSGRFLSLDAILGMFIAIYIVYSSYDLFIKAVRHLLDEELSDKERNKILKIIRTYKQVLGIHELKTRYAGNKVFIQFHLEMDNTSSLVEAHRLGDKITEDILTVFPGAEIIIRQDPGIQENVIYREKI